MDRIGRIKELVLILNKARKAYYQPDENEESIMSDHQYDKLYDELDALEKETGFILANSPTQEVGYEVMSKLPKEAHPTKMLSLEKTKSIEELKSFLGDKEGVLSWKLDGLTIVANNIDGEFEKALTRGNGDIGVVVTNNARTFTNLPLRVPFKNKLVVHGEAVISYSTFNRINEEMVSSKLPVYRNPRNLCSGSVRQLNSAITKTRSIQYLVFSLIEADGLEFNTVSEQLEWLETQGYTTVDYAIVTKDTIEETVRWFEQAVKTLDLPTDGLVLTYNDVKYRNSLGVTNKTPKHSIAFKWRDEIAETTITDIVWQVGRTGRITPVAVFDVVDLEGTEVNKASLHNVSIIKDLEIGVGDTVTVYKANMIIPQIDDNLTRSNTFEIPEYCPVCGEYTEIRQERDSQVLYCGNEDCPAKFIKKLKHFVSRDALNIEGLAEGILEKLVDMGLVYNYSDLFRLEEYEEEIVGTEGFGYRSYEKLIEAINKARYVTMPRFIYSLGIKDIGLPTAKLICDYFDDNLQAMAEAEEDELVEIEGIGDTRAASFSNYFMNEDNVNEIVELLKELKFVQREKVEKTLEGMVFVCTGALYRFKDRPAMKEVIEKLGGRLSGSVSGNTDYLITNDTTSGTRKNIDAQNLGVPIITEDEFIELFNLEEYLEG